MRQIRLLALLVLILLVLVSACEAPPAEPTPAPEVPTAQPEETVDEAVPEPTEAAITPEPTPVQEPLAALVNGEAIPLAEFERQLARYETSMIASGLDASTPEGEAAFAQGRQWVLDLMIEQALIEQSAIAAGVTVSDSEVDETVASIRDEVGEEAFSDWLDQEGIGLEEMRDQLRSDMLATAMANRIAEAVPPQAEHVHARHIVVGTEEEARRILSQLQAGGDFAALARMHSQDLSTRDLGGDLGVFPLGVLTSEEVEVAVFALQPGQIGDVVESELGYHVVQVVERFPDRPVEEENLRLLRDQAVRDWLEQLRATAEIQVFVTP